MFLKKYFSLLSWSVIIILQACNTTHNYDELKEGDLLFIVRTDQCH